MASIPGAQRWSPRCRSTPAPSRPRPLALPVALAVFALTGCEARLVLGRSCVSSTDCASPYVCAAGRCRVECTTQRDCPLGTFCRLAADGTGSCALPDDPDCRTAGCADGLVCRGSLCVNVCDDASDCPGGSLCEAIDGVLACVRIDAGPDAARPDTGAADAGEPDSGEPDAGVCLPGSCDAIVELAAGSHFTCARTASERLYCWGAADSVARGPAPTGCGSTACVRPAPVLVESAPGVVREASEVLSVSARENGGCLAMRGAPPHCWAYRRTAAAIASDGDGRYARPALLADGSPAPEASAVAVLVRSVLAEGTGGWTAWGSDMLGQHGGAAATNNHTWAYAIPDPLAGASLVAVGDAHACGIVGGEVWCWGANDVGQAGDLTTTGTGASVLGARRVPGISGATDLSLATVHSCAVVPPDVVCWGHEALLGVTPGAGCVGSVPAACPATTLSPPTVPFRALARSSLVDGTCAIDDDGSLWCWGAAPGGGGTVPGRIDLPGPVTMAVVADAHACALVDGALYCWGDNYYGALGRTTSTDATQPPGPVAW